MLERMHPSESAVVRPTAPATSPGDGPSRRDPCAAVAYWGLVVMVVLSLGVRPLISLLGLPSATKNLDGLLVPVVALVVLVLDLRSQLRHLRAGRRADAFSRALPWTVVALGASALVSWVSGTPRSLASLALGYVSVLILPLAVFLALHAARYVRGRADQVVLQVAVVVQLGVGLGQYFHREVATHAPFRADLINGTTSHNLWPAFALPAALVLAVLDRGPRRVVWPAAVVLLGIYAEAKAALLIWIPAMLVTALVAVLVHLRQHGLSRYRPTWDRVAGAAIVVAGIAVLVGGLWYTPSAQGTWQVLRGHTNDLEAFAGDKAAPTPDNPTLRDAVRALDSAVNGSARTAVLGLGPANSVSHAAEVLARGTTSGPRLPKPGPVATSLLTSEGPLQFEDAQSSLLGLWGDLGALGVVLYAASLVTALLCLWRFLGGLRRAPLALVLAGMLVAAPLAASFLLDWMEQASIVLPVALALVMLARGRAPPQKGLTRARARRAQPLPLGPPSGENRVVDSRSPAALPGHDVTAYLRASDELADLVPLAQAAADRLPHPLPPPSAASPSSCGSERPDVLHLHNPYPLISMRVVDAAVKAGVPVVQTVHNHRHTCMKGTYLRDGQTCHDCLRAGQPVRACCTRATAARVPRAWSWLPRWCATDPPTPRSRGSSP